MPPPRSNLSFTPLTEGRTEVTRSVRGNRGEAPVSLIIDSSCRVHIQQIPLSRIERDGVNALRAEFEAFGPVESYRMFTERSGRFLGTVLCTYCNPADASMAVNNMNGRVVDDSILKVTLSRDHGVVMLNGTGDKNKQGFIDNEDESSDGKWQHDRYQAILNGSADLEDEYVFGQRRGGRGRRGGGRGGRGRHVNSVDEAFEEYISARDNLVGAAEAVPKSNNTENDENVDTVPAVVVDTVPAVVVDTVPAVVVDTVTTTLESAEPETNPPE